MGICFSACFKDNPGSFSSVGVNEITSERLCWLLKIVAGEERLEAVSSLSLFPLDL